MMNFSFLCEALLSLPVSRLLPIPIFDPMRNSLCSFLMFFSIYPKSMRTKTNPPLKDFQQNCKRYFFLPVFPNLRNIGLMHHNAFSMLITPHTHSHTHTHTHAHAHTRILARILKSQARAHHGIIFTVTFMEYYR